jgi:serine/threonine protein kinase
MNTVVITINKRQYRVERRFLVNSHYEINTSYSIATGVYGTIFKARLCPTQRGCDEETIAKIMVASSPDELLKEPNIQRMLCKNNATLCPHMYFEKTFPVECTSTRSMLFGSLIVMEKMTETLQDWVGRLQSTLSETHRLLTALCTISNRFVEINRLGVLHMDQHAENIMSDRQCRWRIIDFGLARKIIAGQRLHSDAYYFLVKTILMLPRRLLANSRLKVGLFILLERFRLLPKDYRVLSRSIPVLLKTAQDCAQSALKLLRGERRSAWLSRGCRSNIK